MNKIMKYRNYLLSLLFIFFVYDNIFPQQKRNVNIDSLISFTLPNYLNIQKFDPFNFRITKPIGWLSNISIMPINIFYNKQDNIESQKEYKNLRNFVNEYLNYSYVHKAEVANETSVLDSLKEWKTLSNYNAAIGYYKDIYSLKDGNVDTVNSNISYFIELPKRNNIVVVIFSQTHTEIPEDSKLLFNIINSIISLKN
jgi:hypothetical protein